MILTVDEIRAYVDTDLDDASLQRLVDSAEEAIVAYAGPPGEVTQLVDGGVGRLALARPASAMTTVTESRGTTTTTLDADDYRIRADGYVLERLNTGTNPRSTWYGQISLTYTPVADTATREAVQIELVRIDLASSSGGGGGGLKSESIGDYSASFGSSDGRTPDQQRADALARLNPEPMMAVVGYPHFSVVG
jgi:hypothetical protein